MAMDVAVAGGHGKIALRLLRLLAERGDRARGLIRNLEHAKDLEEAGATPVGADLENLDADAIGRSIAGVDAVVFAAGAGPGSGAARRRHSPSCACDTIVRPGRLTDDPGTARIEAAERLELGGAIPRDDVAATLLACLDDDGTIGKAFDLLGGETPIAEALAAL